MVTEPTQTINVFYSYAHKDEDLRNELEKHLSALLRQGLIAGWHDRKITPGTNWQHEINAHLKAANLVLLLISADFLDSDYCYGIEAFSALERQEKGECHVIPIIVRPVDWRGTPFAHLQCLPKEKAVTEYTNRDSAFREVTIGIRQVVEHLRSSPQPIPTTDPKNRQQLLQRVRTSWIKGVLDASLHHATRIALGLQEKPDAIVNHVGMVMQQIGLSTRQLPPETKITHVYDKANGYLLILGEPGSGKTTLLLELARDLLDRAERGKLQSLPVVFHLSSWAQKCQPLSLWLVEELHIKYKIPRKAAKAWVDTDQILPLLDGLDEVAEIHRLACLTAINACLRERRLSSIVVCSRKREYEALAAQLELDGAVFIQPLTPQQIDDYLASAGPQLDAIRRVLREDVGLQELTTTPLMLDVLAVAYQGMSGENLIGVSIEKQRQMVFEQYVKQVLNRGVLASYTQEQTVRWLSWLAKQMKQHNVTVFYTHANVRNIWYLLGAGSLPRNPRKVIDMLSDPRKVIGMLSDPLCSITWDWMPTSGKRWGVRGTATLLSAAGGAFIGAELGLPAAVVGAVAGGLIGASDTSKQFFGQVFAGEELMQFLLWHSGVAPQNYPRFLDYATEHILLRKVGSGYIFIHQLLLEYFASLEISNSDDVSPTPD